MATDKKKPAPKKTPAPAKKAAAKGKGAPAPQAKKAKQPPAAPAPTPAPKAQEKPKAKPARARAQKPADISDAVVTREPDPEEPRRARFRAWHTGQDAIEELCSFIVERGAAGHLANFCKAKDFNYTSVLKWINLDATRSEMYARAREDRSDTLAEQLLTMTDDEDCTAPIVAENSEGRMVVVGTSVDKGKVALVKIKADNLKWAASKLKPRVYGDKLDVSVEDKTKLSDAQLAGKLSAYGIDMGALVAHLHRQQMGGQGGRDGEGGVIA